MNADIRINPDPAAVARTAAEMVVSAARQASAAARNLSISLSGGSTPKLLYQLLAQDPYRSQIDWSRIEFYFGDERAVPPEHPDSNFKMANEALLAKVPLKPDQIHRIRGEIDPNDAAIEYGRLLKAKFGEGGPDITFLGMGDDGHTASLFPNTEVLSETHHRCVAYFVEKSTTGRSWRITMTAPFINRSAEVIMLITGASKAARLAEVLYGPNDPMRLPIQVIKPTSGRQFWLLDQAAAAQLPAQS